MTDETREFDLFGSATGAVRRAQCAECGGRFDLPPHNGRPQRFCSDPCRRRHKSAQVRAWEACPADDAPTHCEGCNTPLPPRDAAAGRFRRFCSPNCRVRTRRNGPLAETENRSIQINLLKGLES